ncbi:DUF1842 domain-containing protein [Pseudoalteromonas sp. T1lg65]|uniref:DUF1842 domain-containing protein n=1 Tax=Pseudoalteromonas sp. T1lg65 TaxID=2077101 RepID=UPI003F79A75E
MSEQGAFLVKLQYQTAGVGGGSMEIQLVVDAVSGSINGAGHGRILEGTEHSPTFTASGAGHMHATGFNQVTKVGALTGKALVSFPPPAIGSYEAPFTASFAVDNSWNGDGKFSVGNSTYDCKVSLLD